ncbi:MAG: hypothetical protein A2Z83_04270 [Omnitrophica bacterium GWA2_52_8]|nr:MAG: hypothetical protein A2Z83_04270 [Omnitrophica bacterium GWA2_52_8]
MAVVKPNGSSVDFVVRPWVKSGDYWTAYFGLTEKIKFEPDRNGLTSPFPQKDVHLLALLPRSR